jgi:hypothetical protein
MGSIVTIKTDLPPVLAALADVAMTDGKTAARAGGESDSKFQDGVKRTAEGNLKPGEAPYPQPVIQGNRFTRYLVADVRAWLIERAARGRSPQIAARVTAHATMASRKAAEKRAAAQIVSQDATHAKRARRKAPNRHSTDVDLEPAAQPARVQE